MIFRTAGLFLLWVLISGTCFAQDLDYARHSMNKLASEKFAGRGYVEQGDRKAAEYIAKEFAAHGLEKFRTDYYQGYSFPMNTFPGNVKVTIDGKKLKPGRDFLVASNCNGIKGRFDLVWITDTGLSLEALQQKVNTLDMKEKFLVTVRQKDLVKNAKLENVKGVILLREKGLTWSVSAAHQTRNLMVIEVLSDKLPVNAKTISLDIENRFVDNYKTQNLIAFVKGSLQPDSFLVFTAHYDHLGKMGPAIFPGANDNASGTSMLLDLARHYSLPENKPKYSIAFMAFSGEEAGLLGSMHYVSDPLFPLKNIRFLINLDMVGTGSNGIRVVNGETYEKEFNTLARINQEKNYLAVVGKRGPSSHSDHHPFFEKGVPAVFIYTTGDEFREYHNIYDVPEKLPFTKYNELFRLLSDFVKTF